MPDFGAVISRLRSHLGLTVRALADRAKVSHTTIQRAEQSTICSMHGTNLPTLLEALHISHGQLIRLMAADWDGGGRSWHRYQIICAASDLPPDAQAELYSLTVALSQRHNIPLADELPNPWRAQRKMPTASRKIAKGADDATMLKVEDEEGHFSPGRVKRVEYFKQVAPPPKPERKKKTEPPRRSKHA